MKHTYLIKLIIWFGVLFVLGSCTKDDISLGKNTNFSVITLQLPKVVEVSIGSRSASGENTIKDILVVLFQNGRAKCQQFLNPIVNESTISLTITDFSVQSGDTFYIYCNTGVTGISATNADELAEQLITTNDVKEGIPMYGSGMVSEATPLSIELERTLAKASVTCSAVGFSIDNWKVSNVPSQGFIVSSQASYPPETTFKEDVTPANGVANFIPRSDNSAASRDRTYILVQMADQKWYKLDFYKGSGSLGVSDQVPVLNLQQNTHYAFEITEIKSGGYTTEEEAAANDGSNVIYKMEIMSGHGASNGQYSLVIDREQIVLYPVDGQQKEMVVLNISALIPKPENTLSTYYALVHSPDKDIKILGSSTSTDSLNLMVHGTGLTTDNSLRTITLQFSTANVDGGYLEIHLGNIIKRVPITVESSNCYLMDFATKTGSQLLIPVAQANKDGVNRISKDYDLQPCIVWSDQPNITEDNLHVTYNKAKQWIEVVNDITFTGNVVVAVQHEGVIKWSWHIWALGADVLTFDAKHGIYDFRPEKLNTYNDYTFMDRNLGAYTLEKDGRASDWGVQYQFGRKDPFPVSENGNVPATEQIIYHNGSSFTLDKEHPIFKLCMVEQNSLNNLEYSIQNPIRFIKGNFVSSNLLNNSDWYTNDYSSSNNNLWLSKALDKTAYNPCPIGWITPYGGKIGPWYGMHISHVTPEVNGITSPDAGYFPYSPNRLASGVLQYVVNNLSNTATHLWWGYYNSNGASATGFYSTAINVIGVDQRATTHHVRCVRE